MPLITTLIPAYRPDYLGELFAGLQAQTLRDFRVVLSDDSPDALITRLLAEGAYASVTQGLRIDVLRGPRNTRLNHQQLLDHWAGSSPLVHLHLDDDVIFPDFYRAHVAAHGLQPLSVTVSRRWLSGPDGRPNAELPLPAAIAEHAERRLLMSHRQLCASVLPDNANWLGELSNMVMSAEAARRYPTPPAAGINYYGLLDIGMVLEASRHAPVVFLHDHLSVFRQHPGQTTHNVASHGGRIMFLSWIAYALAAWQDGQLDAGATAEAIRTATQRIVGQFGDRDAQINGYLDLLAGHQGGLALLHERFGAWWRALLASQPGTDPARYAARHDHSPAGGEPAAAHA